MLDSLIATDPRTPAHTLAWLAQRPETSQHALLGIATHPNSAAQVVQQAVAQTDPLWAFWPDDVRACLRDPRTPVWFRAHLVATLPPRELALSVLEGDSLTGPEIAQVWARRPAGTALPSDVLQALAAGRNVPGHIARQIGADLPAAGIAPVRAIAFALAAGIDPHELTHLWAEGRAYQQADDAAQVRHPHASFAQRVIEHTRSLPESQRTQQWAHAIAATNDADVAAAALNDAQAGDTLHIEILTNSRLPVTVRQKSAITLLTAGAPRTEAGSYVRHAPAAQIGELVATGSPMACHAASVNANTPGEALERAAQLTAAYIATGNAPWGTSQVLFRAAMHPHATERTLALARAHVSPGAAITNPGLADTLEAVSQPDPAAALGRLPFTQITQGAHATGAGAHLTRRARATFAQHMPEPVTPPVAQALLALRESFTGTFAQLLTTATTVAR